uniref:Uncharacterized protein n=1 Tax=Arundo donax TaxID=35708 RepID=A0A0A8YCJ1_ARUDO
MLSFAISSSFILVFHGSHEDWLQTCTKCAFLIPRRSLENPEILLLIKVKQSKLYRKIIKRIRNLPSISTREQGRDLSQLPVLEPHLIMTF